MDEINENESVLRMRSVVSHWLSSDDWNTTQLIDWFQGYDLPALGHDEEPYLWLLRGIPEADEQYVTERRFASRVVVFLNEHPDVKRPGKRPDQVLYNLFMLCAGLSCSEELADPLMEVLERRQLEGKWRGVEVRSALKSALISNQKDSRLLPTWEDALRDGQHRFLSIDEYDFVEAARLMPPSVAKRGEPALDAIGRALKVVTKRHENEAMREKIFTSLAEKVIHTYPFRPMWGRDLLLQAVQQEWPKWAIEIIPGPYPEYISRIIQNVRNSPFVTARSVNGLITHGFVESESKLPREHPDAHSMEEAHKASVKFLCVGA